MVKDIDDVNKKGQPLYAKFDFEDWAFFSICFEFQRKIGHPNKIGHPIKKEKFLDIQFFFGHLKNNFGHPKISFIMADGQKLFFNSGRPKNALWASVLSVQGFVFLNISFSQHSN